MRRKHNAPLISPYTIHYAGCSYDMPAIELTRDVSGDPVCSKCGKAIPTLVKGTGTVSPDNPKGGKGTLF
jgi:hypothetical protein